MLPTFASGCTASLLAADLDQRGDRIKNRLKRFRNLPADERKALRQKWQNMSPEKRRDVREGMIRRNSR